MSETKHTPFPHLSGCYKTPLGLGIYTEPLKDLNAPEIICETQELAEHVLTSVNARPKVEELVEAAKDAQAVIALFAHGRGLDSREASTQKRLEKAIREVEAALGGKAE